MKRTIKLTESELASIMKRVIQESVPINTVNTEGEQTPYGDIIEYGDRYGVSALGEALYNVASDMESRETITWPLAQKIWSY